jgi:hypothetical protein
MAGVFSDILVLVVAISACYLLYSRGLRSGRLPLPPGPKRKPIIGNLLEWPTDNKEWETFWKWREQYGECITSFAIAAGGLLICSWR